MTEADLALARRFFAIFATPPEMSLSGVILTVGDARLLPYDGPGPYCNVLLDGVSAHFYSAEGALKYVASRYAMDQITNMPAG